jgi:hypothetical protein
MDLPIKKLPKAAGGYFLAFILDLERFPQELFPGGDQKSLDKKKYNM